jgi:hypothetical protein
MNIKYYAVVGLLLIISIMFSPIIPNDSADTCGYEAECDNSLGYVSFFDKYIK